MLAASGWGGPASYRAAGCAPEAAPWTAGTRARPFSRGSVRAEALRVLGCLGVCGGMQRNTAWRSHSAPQQRRVGLQQCRLPRNEQMNCRDSWAQTSGCRRLRCHGVPACLRAIHGHPHALARLPCSRVPVACGQTAVDADAAFVCPRAGVTAHGRHGRHGR